MGDGLFLAAWIAIAIAALDAAGEGVERRARQAARVHSAAGAMGVCRVLPDGRIAAGGAGGLALHDGQKTLVLTALDGLPGTSVGALLVEPPAPNAPVSLWVGLESGLARVTWGASGPRVTQRVEGPDVRALAEADGRVWAGTWGRGVGRLEPDGLSFPLGEAPARVAALSSLRGELHAASAGQGLWRRRDGVMGPEPGAPESPFLWSLLPWKGQLLVGGTTGLWTVGAGSEPLVRSDVRVVVPHGRELLVGTFGEGLFVLHEEAGSAAVASGARTMASVAPFLPARFVTGLDSRGGVVCAATSEGLFVAREATDPAAALSWQRLAWPGPPSSDVSALSFGSGGLAVGTFQSGTALLEGDQWRNLELPLDAARVNVVLTEGPTNGRRTWIGAARGLFRIDASGVWRAGVGEGLPHTEVHALLRMAKGELLVGTARGLARMDAAGSIHAVADRGGPGNAAVWALGERSDGRLLVGTTRGLFHRLPGGPWRRACLAGGELTDDWVTALLVTREHVFVGSYAGGVTRLTMRKGRIERSEGLGGGNVNPGGLARLGPLVCAATMQGLACRCASGEGDWTTVEGAAPGRDVTGVLRAAGRIFVASRRGLAEWPDGGLSLPACTPSAPRF